MAAILLNHTLGGPYGYCWGFFPFRTRTIASLIDDLRGSAELRNYHNNPFDPHAIASLRIGAYEKYTVLEYVDLLTEWGDREFAKLTWDSIANASSLYGMAGEVLGKRPCAVKQRAPKASARCFDDLFAGNRREQGSGAARLMERLTADLLDERDEACAGSVCTAEDTEFFFPYFKLPASAAALSRWDIVEDRKPQEYPAVSRRGGSAGAFEEPGCRLRIALCKAAGDRDKLVPVFGSLCLCKGVHRRPYPVFVTASGLHRERGR